MPTGSPRRALLGRRSESEALETLLDAIRGGESRALVLRGEAGVGKTALLDQAIERATGCRVARAAGVQSEMELPFAGLHQLCASMLDRLACLPDPQRDALGTAFGLAVGSAPDLFLVGLAVLPLALSARASVHLFAGELADAASLFEESAALAAATGVAPSQYGALPLAAFRGHEDEAARLIDACTSDSTARGEGNGLTLAQWATALLCNGLARYDEALAAAEQAAEDPRELWFSTWVAVELIEAASRTGNAERATGSLEWLTSNAGASGSDWGLGIEARSRALLSHGDAAESLYGEAIERLGRTRLRVDLARAHLLYGEWLRRERRRLDSREQLRAAFEMFIAMGIEAFAGRAERELLATGEHVRKRRVDTREALTVQESQVARLAGAGLSNAEIGERLFISQHTVAYHLRKVFNKLDISSRSQLERALPDSASPGKGRGRRPA
jgi:DNA-binding CsgD family transcriptional regulator